MSSAVMRRKKEFVSPLLQPPINRLFVPRPTLSFMPSLHQGKDGYRGPRLSPVADYVKEFAPPKSASSSSKTSRASSIKEDGEIKEPVETRRSKRIKAQADLQAALMAYDPQSYPHDKVTSDPQRTLFIGRLAYSVTEEHLRPLLERFGPIEDVRIVKTAEGKSRGYAFAQFSRRDDARRAYERMDAMRVEGRRIVVDMERGRVQSGWRPRRLGGGLGRTRATQQERK